jgi:hypothetical protein
MLKDAEKVWSWQLFDDLHFRSNAVDRHLAEQSGSSVVAFVALRVLEKLLESGVVFLSKV